MKAPIKLDIKHFEVILAILVIIFLSVFCQIVQWPLILPLLLFLAGVHLYLSRKASVKLFLQLGLLLTLTVFMADALQRYTTINVLYLPVASIGMLTILLFSDLQLMFLMSLLSSFFVSMVLRNDFNLLLIYFVGNLTGAYIVRDARTRGRLIRGGIYISLVQLLTVGLLYPDFTKMFSQQFLTEQIYPLAFSGLIAALVVAATLSIFEYLFGVITNFRLLELSDFNQPLLKRMILEAPGSYHHSLVVSNLAEAAADTIGANGLLARVGSYYHDIGKLEKAEYFVENQMMGDNKHDDIEPSMSRLVVLNHVKQGLEIAKKYQLNKAIIDFIPQHHGTSLMHYFYQRALEEAAEGEKVDELNYRYPGPKPQSKETAIVMLADSAEGATRAIDEPNPAKIEDVVRKVMNNKFIDGQLDECNLSLKEIELIAKTFTRVLSAMYHTRVKYPEKKNGNDNRYKKPAEEMPHPSRPDTQDRRQDLTG